MEKQSNDRLWRIFEAALDVPPAARIVFLAQECGGDGALQLAIEEKLAAWQDDGGFLEAPLVIEPEWLSDLVFDLTEEENYRIGPYRVLEKIAVGGMGSVYLAERADDAFDKRVAVTFVWAGADGTEIARRFQKEREILAKLDHPNIARLIDGGKSADGRLYLIMEYVAGAPITDYCREHRLPLKERLRIFQDVCEAVQYAHQNLVVHRDLKPNNILVTGDGTVKLLDFGIAKILDANSAGESRTILHFLTPAYASPEHLRGERITTTSDVYSLGVLLYELLTGRRPFDAQSAQEALRRIETEEPLRPSLAPLSPTESGLRYETPVTDAPEIDRRRLRGDLDNIVTKALERDPSRRYQSVREFSEDITRHLNGEPVIARDATLAYRLGKRIKRNKGLSLALAIVALALIGGLIVSRQQLRAARERDLIQQRKLYAADMRGAGQYWAERNLAPARELVERHQPNANSSAEDDLRGFEWFYLWNALHPPHLTLQHRAIAEEFAITADRARIYVGTRNSAIELWNLTTRQFERVFAEQRERLRSVSLARNGARLASGGDNGSLFVWDIATGKQLFQNPPPSAVRFYAVALSHNGELLVAGGNDGKVHVWDVNTAKLLHSLWYSEKWVQGLAFSPDGNLLAAAGTGTGDPTIKVWDARSFRFLKAFTGSQNTFFNVNFSPDGAYLAAANRDNQALIWSVADGKLVQTITNYQPDSIWAIDFSPDGKTLATAGAGRTIRLWDLATGRDFASVSVEFEINTIGFQPGSAELVLFVTTGTNTEIFDFQQIKLPAIVTPTASEVTSVAISPDGQTLAYGEAAGRLTLRNLNAAQQIILPVALNLPVECVAFAPDGRTLAITYGSSDKSGTVELRDAVTGQIRLAPGAFNHYVNHLAFAPDGQTLVTANNDGTIIVRDVATSQPTLTIRTEPDDVYRVIYSADGRRLVSLHTNYRARGWDARTGVKLFEFHCLSIGGYSPDGKLFSSSDERYNITLRDGLTGEALRTLRGHGNLPVSMVFSPDGKRLATAGDDLNIKLWAVETGAELLTLKGHARRITSLAFSPDGQTLISGSKDKTLRTWRAATEQEVRTRIDR